MTPKLPIEQAQSTSSPIERELSWTVASSLFASFKYAAAGIGYAFTTQRNFRIHVVIGSLAIGLALFLHLEAVKVAIIVLTIGLVLALELLNTALESVVDLTVQQTFHPLAKIAKDCAAGAVMVSALSALAIASSLIFPPLFDWFQTTVGS
ncbi:diacylglycerol kinase family protein [Oscillatoriales cyanobacterium LEGE 11467]|uniref:Diacylglycerol kinase family protein n=2 Tax=Zarconia TaxID=2992130 RepID=A0A928Z8W5_9CYAN|nr:diacylglycerol kinase family protein [Zarconia navalis]MBE9041965.1 diacylglycerol kinase family protein [Zarconia navalis LEGE 11467]